MTKGRSVRLYLPDGVPTGILTAEIVNWTGHVLSAPRARLADALQRPELRRTGIYILSGTPLETDVPQVYVGEGDDISQRLTQHARDPDKTYWDRFVAVTNKDMNLTKAHVKYIESRLVALLTEARQTEVMNKTQPKFDRLPEADLSDMDAFVDELLLILPVIGISFFRPPRPLPGRQDAAAQDTAPLIPFRLVHDKKGIAATAVELDGEFILLAGSTGDLNEGPSFRGPLKTRRDQMLATDRIQNRGSGFVVTQDIAFSSPSAAAVFLFGTSRNGRTDWTIDGTGQTYGDWKDATLPAL